MPPIISPIVPFAGPLFARSIVDSVSKESCTNVESNRRRRRLLRRRRPSCRQNRQHSLPDQRSLAGTSSARAAGVTLPHGTMRRSSSRAATQRRSHHPTARHEGGWAALRCRSRPVRSLQKAFELRSCHLRAPCPPSRGACDSPSLWRGRGTSCSIVAGLN